MPEVKDAKQKRERKLEIPLNNEGDSLAIKWSPANLTPDVYEAIVAFVDRTKGAAQDPLEVARVIVVPLMTWWDLTDGGEPYPITAENVADFGVDWIRAVATAIQDDWQTGPATKKGSGGG